MPTFHERKSSSLATKEEKITEREKMSDYLPTELVQSILLRLPMKPLLRCTSVCQTWYNLITSPEFISAHLNFTKTSKNSTHLLVDYSSTRNGKFDLCCALYFDDDDDTIETSNPFAKIVLPQELSDRWSFRVVTSCNGLICLSNICQIDFEKEPDSAVILYNPAIKRFIHLPESNVKFGFCVSPNTFGFGFDPISNDYKVLRVYSWDEVPPVVQIFKLSTGLWEEITYKAPFRAISGRSLQANRNGVAHWIGEDMSGKLSIVWFDMQDEVFGSFDFPDGVVKDDGIYEEDWEKYLYCFEESLFLIHRINTGEETDEDDYLENRQVERKYDFWMMKEYGEVESWTKVHTLVLEVRVELHGFRRTGEFLLSARGGRMISINLEEGQFKYLGKFSNASSINSCSYYAESLVLLDQTSSTGNEQVNIVSDELVNFSSLQVVDE